MSMSLSRRTFLKAVSAALASLFLPRGLRAGRWEQPRKPVTACPSCGDIVYTIHDDPTCPLCGKQASIVSGGPKGASWKCPEGHYEECLYEGKRWCYKNGLYESLPPT
jgi:hypothetical protein